MIAIKGWARFQHYKHRDPPWIRLYRSLLNDREWFSLDGEAAKVLVSLWLIASENEGRLPKTADLAFRLRTTEKQIASVISRLSHWLEHDASGALADSYQDATPETETETETETEKKEVARCRAPYPEDFEEFWKGYPSKSGKHEALSEWKKLSAQDRLRATGSLSGFKEWIGRQSKDYTVLWACRYLKRKRFEDYPPLTSATVLPIKGFHARDGTPEMAAWDAHWRATKGTNAPRSKRLDGYIFDSRWPPGHEATGELLEAPAVQGADGAH